MCDCLCKFKSVSEVDVFVGAVGIRLWSQDASDDDLCMCVLLAESLSEMCEIGLDVVAGLFVSLDYHHDS